MKRIRSGGSGGIREPLWNGADGESRILFRNIAGIRTLALTVQGGAVSLMFAAGILLLMLLGGETARGEEAYGYILPNSSWTYLSREEIADMPLQVVCYAKNEIYARNGRRFVSHELQQYFEQQYWYSGIYAPEQFTPDMLNAYETANVGLLDSREAELGTYALDSGYYDYSQVYQYMNASYYSYFSNDPFYVDPDSYVIYDSDRRYLSSAELSQMSLQELCYAKNEIYARKGRLFQSVELSDYFYQKNWYWGYLSPEQFSESYLNEYEKANIQTLLNEEYARQSGGYLVDQPGYTYSGISSYTSYYAYTPAAADYVIWDSNLRYLSESEVAGLSLQQLNYARNEIYARRGYIFQAQELRDYFGSKYWYYGTIPSSQFSASVFNDYEKANIELLKRYEYAMNPNGYQLY